MVEASKKKLKKASPRHDVEKFFEDAFGMPSYPLFEKFREEEYNDPVVGSQKGANEENLPKEPLSEKESRALLKYIAEKAKSDVVCDLAIAIIKNAPEVAQEFSENSKAKPSVPQWKDRDTTARKEGGGRITVVDWIHSHHGLLHDDGTWEASGLKRSDLRYDMPLYTAFAQWLKKHPEDDFDPDSRRELKRYDDPLEAVQRLRAQKRESAARLKKQ